MAQVQIGKKFIKIKHAGDSYDVPLSEVRTPAAIVRWVDQLAAKSWATRDTIQGFVDVACRAAGCVGRVIVRKGNLGIYSEVV